MAPHHRRLSGFRDHRHDGDVARTDSHAAPVYRAPMRSRRDDVDPWAGVRRALTLGVCGVGGRLRAAPTTLAEAVAAVAVEHDDRGAARVERFAGAPVGAWVWTREAEGVFRLGRLEGPWGYDGTTEAIDVDLVHVRPCTWASDRYAEHEVPAAVALAFRRGGRNFQRTHHPDVSAESERLWQGADR